MMRFPGRMLPGSGAGPFTGHSESRSLPASRNAMWRAPALGPSAPRATLVRGAAGRATGVLGVARAGALSGGAAALRGVESATAGRGVVSATAGRGGAALRDSTVSAGAGRTESRVATGGGGDGAGVAPVCCAPRAHAATVTTTTPASVHSRTMGTASGRSDMIGRPGEDTFDGMRARRPPASDARYLYRVKNEMPANNPRRKASLSKP